MHVLGRAIRMPSLPFVMRSPAKAAEIRRFVILTLIVILGAAIVEAEDLVGQVLPGSIDGKSFDKAIADLSVHLHMRVKVVVARRPVWPPDWWWIVRGYRTIRIQR